MDKPIFVTEKYLQFLDNLRESGATNMYGATPYITTAFPKLGKDKAMQVLQYWMRTFSERHPKGN